MMHPLDERAHNRRVERKAWLQLHTRSLKRIADADGTLKGKIQIFLDTFSTFAHEITEVGEAEMDGRIEVLSEVVKEMTISLRERMEALHDPPNPEIPTFRCKRCGAKVEITLARLHRCPVCGTEYA